MLHTKCRSSLAFVGRFVYTCMGTKFELFLGYTDHVLLTSSNNKKVVPAFSSVTNLLGQNFSPEVYSFVWFGFSPSQCRIIPYFLISMVEHIIRYYGMKRRKIYYGISVTKKNTVNIGNCVLHFYKLVWARNRKILSLFVCPI